MSSSKFIHSALLQSYLKDIQHRNKIEVESHLSFVKDYISIQRELVQAKRDYLKAKSDLEKRSATGGDQTELRELREELDRLKGRVGN